MGLLLMELMGKQLEEYREIINSRLNEFTKRYEEGFLTYFIIKKISTDLVPKDFEKVIKLSENKYLQDLATDKKEHIVYLASDIVKEEIKLSPEEFHNQLKVIDNFIINFNDFFIKGHLKREPLKLDPNENATNESDLGLIQMLKDITKEDLSEKEIIDSLKIELPNYEEAIIVNELSNKGFHKKEGAVID